jgi:hypothetical protein
MEGKDAHTAEHEKVTRKRTRRNGSQERTRQSKAWTLREYGGKPVWDWMQLLIVPVVLALVTVAFTLYQEGRQTRIENRRAGAERELAEQRAQDGALQAYLDQMSQLLLDRKLLEAEQGAPLYTLAQARTSTLILRLDAEHNESVTRFLVDSGLAESSEASARLLRGITLSHATLSDAYLPDADLRQADLSGANLSGANLFDADLSETNLSEANLIYADLSGTIAEHRRQQRQNQAAFEPIQARF